MSVHVLDRRFKPLPWEVHPDRVAEDCRWSHRGLILSWPLWDGSSLASASATPFRVQDPITGRHGVSSTGAGNWTQTAGVRGRVLATDGGSATQLRAPMTRFPTTAATIICAYRKTGANAISGIFGCNNEAADATRNIGAHCPYSDGTVYWDYGGTGEGTTRKSVGGLTFGDDVWVFTAGPRGMEIWQNRLLRASHSTPSGRTNVDSDFFQTGWHNNVNADSAQWGALLVYDRQLTPAQIVALSVDPWTPFRPARTRRYAVAAAAAIDPFVTVQFQPA